MLMKKVMLFGTFDGLHAGHCHFFEQARAHGDWVIAVVARDETVTRVKGRPPRRDIADRLQDVLSCGLVHDVVMGTLDEDKTTMIRTYAPHIVFLGYDQMAFVDDVYALQKASSCDFIIVWGQPYKPDVYKSSLLDKRDERVVSLRARTK